MTVSAFAMAMVVTHMINLGNNLLLPSVNYALKSVTKAHFFSHFLRSDLLFLLTLLEV